MTRSVREDRAIQARRANPCGRVTNAGHPVGAAAVPRHAFTLGGTPCADWRTFGIRGGRVALSGQPAKDDHRTRRVNAGVHAER